MCGIAYISKPYNINKETIKTLLSYLEKKRGGDGWGVCWFENGKPFVYKGVKLTIDEIMNLIELAKPDTGILLHTRMASVGKISDENCHPFLFGNSFVVNNGHVSLSPALKLILMENSTWTKEKALSSTDSEVIGYFMNKYGFEISEMFNGVFASLTPDKFLVNVNGDFESIDVDKSIIFASEFPESLGLKTKIWCGYNTGTKIEIGETLNIKGSIYDAKKHYLKKQKEKYVDLRKWKGYE